MEYNDENQQGQNEPRRFDKQKSAIESFMGRTPFGEDSTFSWGLILVAGFGVFALVKLIQVIFFFF